MTEENTGNFSITIHTLDAAVAICLVGLAQYVRLRTNQPRLSMSQEMIRLRKTRHRVTVLFSTKESHDMFLAKANQLLIPENWTPIDPTSSDEA